MNMVLKIELLKDLLFLENNSNILKKHQEIFLIDFFNISCLFSLFLQKLAKIH